MRLGFLMFFTALSLMTDLLKAQNDIIKLWPNGIPGAIENPGYSEYPEYHDSRLYYIYRVTEPELEVFPAPKEKSNGTAVIICPGGGYTLLSFHNEGYPVSEWLNSLGITAFILKSRLPSDKIMKDKSTGPLQDAQRAMEIVRKNAKDLNIDPGKIGILGFSAGGHLAASLSVHYDDTLYKRDDSVSLRPNFSILIYPVITMQDSLTHKGSRENLLGKKPDDQKIRYFSCELNVTENTPSAFLVHAENDQTVPVENSINYFMALKSRNIPAELHIYEQGGHGFGLGTDSTSSEYYWKDACEKWLWYLLN
jgi:acetyl esterase/lipase